MTSVTSEEPIIDFSVYRDQVLDVLTPGAITEYDIKDGSLLETYPIRDNDVILTGKAKVDEDSIDMTGYLDGTAYDCGYLVDRAYFYSVARPAPDYLVSHAHVPAASGSPSMPPISAASFSSPFSSSSTASGTGIDPAHRQDFRGISGNYVYLWH